MQETRVRVLLTLRGLRPPEVQYTIIAQNGAFIARVDLAWPELKIAVEYDGVWHVGSARQMNYDRRRLNRLISEGWFVLFVTAPRLRDDLDGLDKELRAALWSRKAEVRRARGLNAGAREDSM